MGPVLQILQIDVFCVLTLLEDAGCPQRVVHFQGKVGEPSLKTVDPQFFWSEGDFESLEFQNKAAKSGGWLRR